MDNKLEFIEDLVIMLVGSKDSPVPSEFHLQKELFIVSNSMPRLKGLLVFEKHYRGPYCQEVDEIYKNPLNYDEIYEIKNRKISLNERGKKVYQDVLEKHKDVKKINLLLNSFKLVRDIYDKFSEDELLYFIYRSYPEYIENSNAYRKLDNNKRKLVEGMLNKKLISKERHDELLENE